MTIKILDSWLKEYLKTNASAQTIAEVLSLRSASVDRIKKLEKDYIYEIEITTNRPDLMSVLGLAQEATAVLNEAGIDAEFRYPEYPEPHKVKSSVELNVVNTIPHLVYRVLAVVMEINIKESPEFVRKRLESTGIRSLNNVIDITNYVMRTTGHPTHVFDYDRIYGNLISIREAKKNEKITTFDGKTHVLSGGDIIATDGKQNIIDLLAVMGLENSVVTHQTKRIVYFIDNNAPDRIRKTSMGLAIRTEAAVLEEKGVDPNLAYTALLQGIQLFETLADGKILSDIIDIYPSPYKSKTINITEDKIKNTIDVPITLHNSAKILQNLGFKTEISGNTLSASVPSFRKNDIEIPEDLIEEIARVYGYHKLPLKLPLLEPETRADYIDEFYSEDRVKDALKYWGFSEVYTYSMVSEKMFEGPLDSAVTIKNPLTEETVYMRNSLVPSLIKAVSDNPTFDELKLFELANVYLAQNNDLPIERLHLAGIVKKPNVSFFEVKGIIEQLANDLGITDLNFKYSANGNADVFITTEKLGNIEVLGNDLIDFECRFDLFIKYANFKKTYTSIPKYPSIIEDMAFLIQDNTTLKEIMDLIKKQSQLIKDVVLFDKYQNVRTFRIIYQHIQRNLTTKDIEPIRKKIVKSMNSIGVRLK